MMQELNHRLEETTRDLKEGEIACKVEIWGWERKILNSKN